VINRTIKNFNHD